MALVTLNYWAGARAAAGTASETVGADTIGGALTLVFESHADPRFVRVVRASSLLVDGVAVRDADLDAALSTAVTVEVLPPYAGG